MYHTAADCGYYFLQPFLSQTNTHAYSDTKILAKIHGFEAFAAISQVRVAYLESLCLLSWYKLPTYQHDQGVS